MALNKSKLKNDILSLLQDMMTREENSMEEFAQRLSDVVDDYVKGAKITYTTGLMDFNSSMVRLKAVRPAKKNV